MQTRCPFKIQQLCIELCKRFHFFSLPLLFSSSAQSLLLCLPANNLHDSKMQGVWGETWQRGADEGLSLGLERRQGWVSTGLQQQCPDSNSKPTTKCPHEQRGCAGLLLHSESSGPRPSPTPGKNTSHALPHMRLQLSCPLNPSKLLGAQFYSLNVCQTLPGKEQSGRRREKGVQAVPGQVPLLCRKAKEWQQPSDLPPIFGNIYAPLFNKQDTKQFPQLTKTIKSSLSPKGSETPKRYKRHQHQPMGKASCWGGGQLPSPS